MAALKEDWRYCEQAAVHMDGRGALPEVVKLSPAQSSALSPFHPLQITTAANSCCAATGAGGAAAEGADSQRAAAPYVGLLPPGVAAARRQGAAPLRRAVVPLPRVGRDLLSHALLLVQLT